MYLIVLATLVLLKPQGANRVVVPAVGLVVCRPSLRHQLGAPISPYHVVLSIPNNKAKRVSVVRPSVLHFNPYIFRNQPAVHGWVESKEKKAPLIFIFALTFPEN
jgi:hypothetical protein